MDRYHRIGKLGCDSFLRDVQPDGAPLAAAGRCAARRQLQPAGRESAMKQTLTIAAVGEFSTGLLLLAFPPMVIRLLFAAEIAGAGVIMTRITGISLMALAAACWPNADTAGPFVGMLTYSLLAGLYLIVLGIGGGGGLLLWPAVLAHAALSVFLIRARFLQGNSKAMTQTGSL